MRNFRNNVKATFSAAGILLGIAVMLIAVIALAEMQTNEVNFKETNSTPVDDVVKIVRTTDTLTVTATTVFIPNLSVPGLTDDAMADTLHRHSELSASDGVPDKVLRIDGGGDVELDTKALGFQMGDLDLAGNGTRIDLDDVDATFVITAQNGVDISAGLTVAGNTTFDANVAIGGNLLTTGTITWGTLDGSGITGVELETLSDGSVVSTEHSHSSLDASDGSPSGVLTIDAGGAILADTKQNIYLGDDSAVGNGTAFEISDSNQRIIMVSSAGGVAVEVTGSIAVSTTLTVTGDITGPNVTTGVDPGHSHTVSAPSALTILIECRSNGTITKGEAVTVIGVSANKPQVDQADNTVDASEHLLGIATATVGNNQNVDVIVTGELGGLNTNAWTAGDELFMSTGGALVNVAPTIGAVVHIGEVLLQHPNSGTILVDTREVHIKGMAAGVDRIYRMGDDGGANIISYRDYANDEVAKLDSNGLFYTDQINALSAAGLSLFEDGGEGLFVEDSTGDVAIGHTSPETKLDILNTGTGNNRGIILHQRNDGTHSAILDFVKGRDNSGVDEVIAVDDLVGRVAFNFFNSTPAKFFCSLIDVQAKNVTAASEACDMRFFTATGGTLALAMTLEEEGGILMSVGGGVYNDGTGAWDDSSLRFRKMGFQNVSSLAAWNRLDDMQPVRFRMRDRRRMVVTVDGRTITAQEARAETEATSTTLESLTSGTLTEYLDVPLPGVPVQIGFVAEDLPSILRTPTGVNATKLAAQNTAALKEAKRRIIAQDARIAQLEATQVAILARLDALEKP